MRGCIAGDIRVLSSVRSAVADFAPEVIVNLASQTELEPTECGDYTTNTLGVENLVRAMASTPSVRRAVWTSSILVNRPGVRVRHDEDYNPKGAYGESKVAGEKIVRNSDGAGKTWTIIRPTTIWGPGMSPHYQRLLSLIQRGLYFHVGGKPLRKSYSYIGNFVRQVTSLIDADPALVNRRTFYVADSEPIELREWCDGFARWFGVSIPTMPKVAAIALAKAGDMAGMMGLMQFPLNSHRLENMLTEYVFDTGPLEAIAGKTVINSWDGIRMTAQWYLSR
jgi:nucleoside-diphosphate-sugar epimerase